MAIFPILNGENNITSFFGSRTAPTAGASTNHQGIDIAAPTGTAVLAAAPGRVLGVLRSNAKGNYIELEHSDGSITEYAHLSSAGVTPGQYVTAGQTIGQVGSTGIATGPHLHFGVKVGGSYVDPQSRLSSAAAQKGGTSFNLDNIGETISGAVNDYWLWIIAALVVFAVLTKRR